MAEKLKFPRKDERKKEKEAERRGGRKERMEKERRREMKCERVGWYIGTEEDSM